jgi:hypothetical protein
MRRGFGIVYAVIILVLIATIGIYTLELSSRSVKSVSDEHIKIQMRLYMNSAVEYALLWLSDNTQRSNPTDFGGADPWSDLNITYENRYRFQLRMYETHLDVPESNGTVMLDIVGRFDDTGAEPIVVTRRLIVKP